MKRTGMGDQHGLASSQWKLILLALLIVTGLAALLFTPISDYFTEEGLQQLLASVRRVWWTPFIVVGLLIIASPLGIPTTPLLLGGAAFGVWLGSFYNTIGLILGAALSYELARVLGRDFVLAVTGDRIRGIEKRFQRFVFWPLVQLNFMPLPFPVLNYGAALSGVRRASFLSAMTIGLIPSTVLHTYFIGALVAADWDKRGVLLAAYIAAFLLFNVLIGYPWIRSQRKRRHTYRRLKSMRSGRKHLFKTDDEI
ncbi:MAG: TVP38/TMEM64 family inner membrane protein YdjZ [Gammaproteobacteria bacterium]|nr:TVP38/TMEM64 family inner membrane protein YdjZ [Gammaproteobacteria bacterium]